MTHLTDIRVSRTKELLKKALIDLMQTTSAKSISVQRLTTAARVSRVTFYRHYQGMPDFLLQTIDNALSGLFVEPKTVHFHTREHALEYYTDFFSHVKANADVFTAMLGPNGMPEFYQRFIHLRRLFHERMMSTYRNEFSDRVNEEVMHTYFSSALLGLIEYWLTEGSRYTAEYMADQVFNIAHLPVLKKIFAGAGESVYECTQCATPIILRKK